MKFYDGLDELGKATIKTAMPAGEPTTSFKRSSGVTSKTKTKWSKLNASSSSYYKAQKVTKDYKLSNISPLAGQVQLTVALNNFNKVNSIKINGETLKTSLKKPGFQAALESERWGGSVLKVTVDMGKGTESKPAAEALKIEVDGQFRVYS
jgi:hypothetical protein